MLGKLGKQAAATQQQVRRACQSADGTDFWSASANDEGGVLLGARQGGGGCVILRVGRPALSVSPEGTPPAWGYHYPPCCTTFVLFDRAGTRQLLLSWGMLTQQRPSASAPGAPLPPSNAQRQNPRW